MANNETTAAALRICNDRGGQLSACVVEFGRPTFVENTVAATRVLGICRRPAGSVA